MERLFDLGVRRVALADTYGVATAEVIGDTLGTAKALSPAGLELGAHLHSRREGIQAKLDAVLNSGVRWLVGRPDTGLLFKNAAEEQTKSDATGYSGCS